MKKLNIIVTSIAGIATVILMGCRTAPPRVASPLENPSLAGSWMVVETATLKAKVDSVDTSQRKIVLSHADGVTPCKAGPDAHFAFLKAGDQVKATVILTRAIFPLKVGAPPSAGAGVKVAEVPEWALSGGIVLQTVDMPAKVLQVDTSYRMLKVQYDNGTVKEFKTDLSAPLNDVKPGDKLVVRETEGIVSKIKPI